jgi:hypothetical protein
MMKDIASRAQAVKVALSAQAADKALRFFVASRQNEEVRGVPYG